MINYNGSCLIRQMGKHDIYGRPTFKSSLTERCCIVQLKRKSQHTTVRADSSASRGHGDELVASVKVLLDSRTSASIGDQLIVAGIVIRIDSMDPKVDVTTGEVDHYETTGEAWA